MIITDLGFNLNGLVAGLGVGSVVITLAAQDTAKSLIGGLAIFLDKPFKVGDYIYEDTHGNEGTVTEIQLCYTKLLTVDNKTVVLPNGNLANSSLTNMTQQDKRLIDITVGISYDADIRLAKQVISVVLEQEKKCMTDEETYHVFVDSLGDSAVVIGIRVWVKTADYWETRWRITENVKYALDEHQIEIPFPQVSVSMKQDHFAEL